MFRGSLLGHCGDVPSRDPHLGNERADLHFDKMVLVSGSVGKELLSCLFLYSIMVSHFSRCFSSSNCLLMILETFSYLILIFFFTCLQAIEYECLVGLLILYHIHLIFTHSFNSLKV